MGRQKLIHLHGTTKLEDASKLNVGEIAVRNAAAGTAELYITNGEGTAVVNFIDAAAVNSKITTASNTLNDAITALTQTVNANEADIEAKVSAITADYLKAADKTALENAITAATEDLQGQIDAMDKAYKAADEAINNKIGTVAEGDTVVSMIASAETAAKDYADEKLGGLTEGKTVAEMISAAEAAAIATAKTYTDEQIASAKTELQGYADQAELDAIAAAKTYTNEREAAIKVAYEAYADQAEADAITSAKTYTNEREAAIIVSLTAHTDDTTVHITATERTDWNKAKADIDAFLADADTTEKAVDTLKEIQEFLTGEDGAVDNLLESVAANADAITALTQTVNTNEQDIEKKVSDMDAAYKAADKAINDKIGTVAEDTTVVDMISAAQEAAQDYADEKLGGLTEGKTVAEMISAAEAAAIDAATAYTATREEAITEAYEGYADQAELDAITSAKAYTNEREAAIKAAYEGYADQAELDAIAAAKTYTDTEIDKVEKTISDMDAAYKLADSGLDARIQKVEAWQTTVGTAVQSVVVDNTDKNGITATKNGTAVNLNFDNMVIDCGLYE